MKYINDDDGKIEYMHHTEKHGQSLVYPITFGWIELSGTDTDMC
jgi:hypothetical protein